MTPQLRGIKGGRFMPKKAQPAPVASLSERLDQMSLTEMCKLLEKYEPDVAAVVKDFVCGLMEGEAYVKGGA